MTRRPRRRDNGEGTAYQRADGRWVASVTIGWETTPEGRRRRVRRDVYGATEQEAKQERNDLLLRVRNGEVPLSGRMTVRVWLAYWLDVICVERDLTASTLDGYRRHVERWINPVIGDVRLHDVGPDDVERVYRAMRTAGRAPSYILGCHRTMSRAFKVAARRKKITVNPCDLLDAPSVPDSEADAYTPDEARAVVHAATEHRGGARWTVALALGIRQGEALGLLRDRVDLDAGTIRIDRQFSRRYGQAGPRRLSRVKSRAGNRTIAIPDELQPILRAHLANVASDRIALGEAWRGCGLVDIDGRPVAAELVFAQADGRPIDHSEDWRDWRTLVERAGVRYINPHGSRHTAATLMLAQGVQPRVAQEILGHSSPTLFNSVYAHVIDELHTDAAAKIGAVLFPPARARSTATLTATGRDSRGPRRKIRHAERPDFRAQGRPRT